MCDKILKVINKDYKKISEGFRMIEWLKDTRHFSRKELQEIINQRKEKKNKDRELNA